MPQTDLTRLLFHYKNILERMRTRDVMGQYARCRNSSMFHYRRMMECYAERERNTWRIMHSYNEHKEVFMKWSHCAKLVRKELKTRGFKVIKRKNGHSFVPMVDAHGKATERQNQTG